MASAQEMLDFYTNAEIAVLSGQRVRYGERDLTRADLEMIQAGRREWQRAVNAESNRRGAGYAVADFGGCT